MNFFAPLLKNQKIYLKNISKFKSSEVNLSSLPIWPIKKALTIIVSSIFIFFALANFFFFAGNFSFTNNVFEANEKYPTISLSELGNAIEICDSKYIVSSVYKELKLDFFNMSKVKKRIDKLNKIVE